MRLGAAAQGWCSPPLPERLGAELREALRRLHFIPKSSFRHTPPG